MFGVLDFLYVWSLDFWNFEFLYLLICAIFFGGFVFSLFVVVCLCYTFDVSSVFLRVPQAKSDFRCTEKTEFTSYWS